MTEIDHPMELMEQLRAAGHLRSLDYYFSEFILQQSGDATVALVAALTSAELGKGHSCLPLYDAHGELQGLFGDTKLLPELANPLMDLLQQMNWQNGFKASNVISQGQGQTPLIFDGQRVYLQRYWYYESQVAARLKHMSQPLTISTKHSQHLAQLLDRLFARDYRRLLEQLIQNNYFKADDATLESMLCEQIDVVYRAQVDWPMVHSLVSSLSDEVSDQELAEGTVDKQLTLLAQLDQIIPKDLCVNWQKAAAAVALSRQFSVISGGPGTGKTTTLTKLLVALIHQFKLLDQTPIIQLAAPTGKAAARMSEQIGKACASLDLPADIVNLIPQDASTLHRLLGTIGNSAEFKHNRHNPLILDILVIDEASMVDLPMMFKLLDALAPHARLILLGDKDQLASVDAGAVLGDICTFHQHGFSLSQQTLINQLTGFSMDQPITNQGSTIADSLCMLQKSYRFHANSGIGQLAYAVNSGVPRAVQQVWQNDYSDIQHYPVDHDHYQQLLDTMTQEYAHYLRPLNALDQQQQSPQNISLIAKQALERFADCRLLCAVHKGDFGVDTLNQRIEGSLRSVQLIPTSDDHWYQGRPVIITRNDHALGLYNGDIGICIFEPQSQRLKVYFELPDGSIKGVLPSRLPQHETAYAMTIHKSQGSEFSHTLMLLPTEYIPVISRELIYTGITRAAKRFSLYANPKIIHQGTLLTTERASGLVGKLAD